MRDCPYDVMRDFDVVGHPDDDDYDGKKCLRKQECDAAKAKDDARERESEKERATAKSAFG